MELEGNIKLIIQNNDLIKEVSVLRKQLEITGKALRLACNTIREDDKIMGIHVRFNGRCYEDYYLGIETVKGEELKNN